MALYHVHMKDHENSGYTHEEFICPSCLEKMLEGAEYLEVISKTLVTPQHLSTVYPPLVTEPHCCGCYITFI